jgi:TatA/E family protein of Tat protein translocase
LKTRFHGVPEIDFRFAQLPTKQNGLLPELAGKIEQSFIKVLYLDPDGVDFLNGILGLLHRGALGHAFAGHIGYVDQQATGKEDFLAEHLEVDFQPAGSRLRINRAPQQRFENRQERLRLVQRESLHGNQCPSFNGKPAAGRFVAPWQGRYHDKAMSLPDTIFIFGLALVIFGPKKLPEIGRQLGKLMLEFRRASNEFKMQIDEELRAAEHADRQKELAAPVASSAVSTTSAPLAETSVETPAEAPHEAPAQTLTVRPPSEGVTVSTESPTSRVIPVHEEVSTLEAAVGEHPELERDALERLSEQATLHND